MTHDEALSKLELEEGATTSEINTQYTEFYNEFQMRITNAPTEHQRKLYQKKMEELSEAFKVLGGENSENNTQELPGIAESDIVETEKAIDQIVSHPIEMSKEKALQFLGLGEKFTSKELENAFKSKVSSCETGRDNAISTSIRNAYEEAIIECNSAYNLLKDYIFIAPPILKVAKPTPKVSKISSASKKKWLVPVSIVSGVIIVVILYFAFGSGNSSTDEQINPYKYDEYVSLKNLADYMAEQKNWQEALTYYEKAYALIETVEVQDSLASMQNHLLLVLNEKNEEANKDKENEASAIKKEKELEVRENALKETERLQKEVDTKRLKIGDIYAGGIVFKVDATGNHGLVCAPTGQGNHKWEEAKIACQNLTLNGYSDWYLPSKYELDLMYVNIGQGSSSNIGGFSQAGYWSSAEATYEKTNNTAWFHNFIDGMQQIAYKTSDAAVRAVRSF